MKRTINQPVTSRRDAMKLIAAGSTAGILGLFESPAARAETHVIPS